MRQNKTKMQSVCIVYAENEILNNWNLIFFSDGYSINLYHKSAVWKCSSYHTSSFDFIFILRMHGYHMHVN